MGRTVIVVDDEIEQTLADINAMTLELYSGKGTAGRDENRFDLTGLTGGAATDLDSLVTANDSYAVGDVVSVVIADRYAKWQLRAGTTAEDVDAGVVRPDDYAGGTNEKYWFQLQ